MNDVHVWVVPPECLAFADSWAILSPDEQHQTRRFRFERDQRVYFAAHVLKRLALSAFTPEVLSKGWRFENRSQGRPEVANPGFTGLLRFNLSHTRGLVAVVVAREIACGIDVEAGDRLIDEDILKGRR